MPYINLESNLAELSVSPFEFYLTKYTLDFTYQLVDCSEDYTANDIFLTKTPYQSNTFVDYLGKGVRFVFQVKAKKSIYELDLVPIVQ